MKNYLKTTFVLTVVALFMFSACSKGDEYRGENEDGRSVSLKLRQEVTDQIVGRAVGPHIDANKTVVFNTGYIYFTSASGEITRTITIESGDAIYANNKVGIETLTADGIVVENIHARSTEVHIVGNLTVAGTPANISEIMATKISVESQYDATDRGVDKVALYGVGDITPERGELAGKAYDFKAELKINPINSRLEIGKFTAGGDIKSYTVEGIFINNYYSEMNFDRRATTVVDNGEDLANYMLNAGSYIDALQGVVFDYDATNGVGEKDGSTTWADSQKDIDKAVWGYNFLVANPVVNPQIAIRIKDVVMNDNDTETYKGTQFISIRKFHTATNSNKELTMASGNVYRIADLQFDEGDLRPKPFEDAKTVLVEATLMEWASTDIRYKLD